MTGRASPGKCATRTGPCFRSSRDLDTYTTFDILPPLRFFQPIPKWEPCYSVDFAWFKKYLDTVAIVVVNSPMLARRPPLTSRSKSFPCIRLQPLRALFSHPSLYFQSLAASFCKTPGVGYPECFYGTPGVAFLCVASAPSASLCPEPRRVRYHFPLLLSPLSSCLAPLPDSSSMLFRINTCKSVSKQRTLTLFRINTYEKRGEGGNHGKPNTPSYSAPAFFVRPSLRKVPFSSSVKAWRSCSCVFITMGPYQATGSSRGLPETRRKRMPSSPACTMTSSPRSNRTSERLSAAEGGAVSSQPTDSVGTDRGSLALENLPEPAKTYAKAWRVVSTGRAFLRPGATETSTYTGSVAMPSTGPRLPQKLPHTSRTCVPSSSVISGISGDFTSW